MTSEPFGVVSAAKGARTSARVAEKIIGYMPIVFNSVDSVVRSEFRTKVELEGPKPLVESVLFIGKILRPIRCHFLHQSTTMVTVKFCLDLTTASGRLR